MRLIISLLPQIHLEKNSNEYNFNLTVYVKNKFTIHTHHCHDLRQARLPAEFKHITKRRKRK
jgi:hypothetical protein